MPFLSFELYVNYYQHITTFSNYHSLFYVALDKCLNFTELL